MSEENTNHIESEDDIWTLIADLRHWLEWQADCGAEDWAVEDWSAWTRPIPRALPAQTGASPTPPKKRFAPKAETVAPPEKHVKPKASPPPPKKITEIPSAWQNIIENAAPVLNVSAVPVGKEGFDSVRLFQKTNCREAEACQIGYGNILASVLIIAGDLQPMKPEGFKMLTNMREHVLKLDKTQLYFMNYPLGETSHLPCQAKLCKQIFQGLLRAQSPKFILVMGEVCSIELFGLDSRPVMGELGELRCQGTVGQAIPALWTHHPHFLLENGHEKRTAMRHLQNMRRLLLKHGLT